MKLLVEINIYLKNEQVLKREADLGNDASNLLNNSHLDRCIAKKNHPRSKFHRVGRCTLRTKHTY